MVTTNDMETYQAVSEVHGDGTFFFTDCGNRMYSVRNDHEAYHGCKCPKCGKVLYMRGSKESNEYWSKKLTNMSPIANEGRYNRGCGKAGVNGTIVRCSD